MRTPREALVAATLLVAVVLMIMTADGDLTVLRVVGAGGMAVGLGAAWLLTWR